MDISCGNLESSRNENIIGKITKSKPYENGIVKIGMLLHMNRMKKLSEDKTECTNRNDGGTEMKNMAK